MSAVNNPLRDDANRGHQGPGIKAGAASMVNRGHNYIAI